MGRKIIVDIDLPYERLVRMYFDTQERALDWILKNPSMYENCVQNIEMYLEPEYIDIKSALSAKVAG
jgi:hypothetical protein